MRTDAELGPEPDPDVRLPGGPRRPFRGEPRLEITGPRERIEKNLEKNLEKDIGLSRREMRRPRAAVDLATAGYPYRRGECAGEEPSVVFRAARTTATAPGLAGGTQRASGGPTGKHNAAHSDNQIGNHRDGHTSGGGM